MSKHTPAPWYPRIVRDEDGEVQMAFVSAKDVNGFSYDAEILGEDEYRGDVDRQLSDVHLVASAPELLEALTEMIDLWEDVGGDMDNPTVIKARQAIAKAEGK
jgi:hypothetical protein